MESPSLIRTPRLDLALGDPSRAAQMALYVARNREHFACSSSPCTDEMLTDAYWRARLESDRRDFEAGVSLRLVLVDRERQAIAGECSFTNIVRGVFQACYLGYRLDRGRVGEGLMYEALSASIAYVFGELRLHRVMANYQPTNQRSGVLLRRLGFVVEGYARDYLYLDGAWRDHVLTALTNPEVVPS